MVYVALLRGINVGGNNKVPMAQLRLTFENLGFDNVKTYINSGNVIFSTLQTDTLKLAKTIETAIEKDFKLPVQVVIRDLANIQAVEKAVPKAWVNNTDMKCDILFLWQAADNKAVLDQLIIKPGIDNASYVPGAVIWQVDRANIGKSGLLKIVGTPLYKQVTIRNVNTLRKLVSLMKQINEV